MTPQGLSETIKHACEIALGAVAPNLAPDFQSTKLTPTQAMFVLAVDGMSKSPLAGLDEESLTAIFAGRMSAQYGWAVTCLSTNIARPALWGQYSKNGQGPSAESKRGADFALVIPVTDDIVRIAIFQAKKARNDLGDLSQSGSKTSPAPQLQKLIDTASEIKEKVGINSGDPLGWVHYVFWQEIGRPPKSISLSALEKNLLADLTVDISNANFGSFAELLLVGTTASLQEDGRNFVTHGWLQLRKDDAIECLPLLLEITDVVYVDDKGGGRQMANILATECTEMHIQEPVATEAVSMDAASTTEVETVLGIKPPKIK